jgi:hypothetical protein
MSKIDQWPKGSGADKIGKELPEGTEKIDHPDGKVEFILPDGGVNMDKISRGQLKRAVKGSRENTIEPSFSADNLVQMNKNLRDERKSRKGQTNVPLTNQDRKKELGRATREAQEEFQQSL